jgi:steroid 5-alpha reductase family enzyme
LDKHIRKIFSVFVLGMIALCVMRINAGDWTMVNWGMLLIAALCCCLVFKCFVFIFNFSYALACIFNGALIAIALPSVSSMLLGGAIVIYGLRLFLFTLNRYRSESYQPRVENVQKEDAKLPFPIKIALWLQCSFLYVFHLFAIYMVASAAVLNSLLFSGIALILFGTFIEALGDSQKQAGKRKTPDTFVSNGILARWRHPNYTGEIIVQVGLIVAGFSAVSAGWANYAAFIIAPLYIILLMISEGGRADKYQLLRYGDDEGYKRYVARSGSLLPRL